MKDHICQMVAEGIHAPQQIIKAKSYPTQWLVVAHIERGKHPLKLSRSQAFVMWIIDEI
jgi:hypothetical protein